jgi:creatinine amidohydrolase
MEQVRERLAADGGSTVVIVPFGSVEQHGSHLPLSTDTLQASGVAVRAARITPCLVAPPVHYGQCSSTRNHPGTITVSAGTVRSLARDIVGALVNQGVRRIILYSGHAGRIHMAALREAAEGCVRHDESLRIAVVSDLELVKDNCADILDTPNDGHAGEIETSRMMYLHDELVGKPPEEEYPRLPRGQVVPDPENYWEGGVWGNPRAATVEKGKLLIERSAEALADIVKSLQ